MRKASFAPVVTPDTRVLILGSLPGEASLAAGRYYAHPQNQFWRLMGGVVGRDLAALDYDARLSVLLSARVGLWDTVGTARREGSLDGALRAIEGNPLADLTATLPALRAVGFNGATAARLGHKALAWADGLALLDLPSSSAAFCRIGVAEKARAWNRLRDHLA
ncbi:MAG: DNA-deoxyinosine glycosylase [Novosphingobium sp.]